MLNTCFCVHQLMQTFLDSTIYLHSKTWYVFTEKKMYSLASNNRHDTHPLARVFIKFVLLSWEKRFLKVFMLRQLSLCEKCPNTDFFLVLIFLYSYGDLLSKSTYSVRIQKKTDLRKLRIWTFFTQCMCIFCLCMKQNGDFLHFSVLCFFFELRLSILYKQLSYSFNFLQFYTTVLTSVLQFAEKFDNLSSAFRCSYDVELTVYCSSLSH